MDEEHRGFTPIRRLAVVDRGAAAGRALTAVAELNRGGTLPPITTVLPHAEADAGARYLREAEETVPLGAAAAFLVPAEGQQESARLDAAAVVRALVDARVDAVWPGWGPLARSAGFAERCEKVGILVVGPDSAAIRRLADEGEARRLAEKVGITVADRGAAPEQGARRVEVQILADAAGTVWTLGVREGTIRRGGRAIVAESACPALPAALEQQIRESAALLVSAAGYQNVGTVEFLVEPDGSGASFLEFDPCLSAAHAVTEAAYGVDLVKLQLHIAAGGRLPEAGPPPRSGHAIEVTLSALDPERGFEPAPGRLAAFAAPSGAGVRVDTDLREGDVISPVFEPEIAKITAWGADRGEALARLRRALAGTTVAVRGGTTDLSFLLRVLDRPEVAAGTADTGWLDGLIAQGGHLPTPDPLALIQAAIDVHDDAAAKRQAGFHDRAARGRPELPRGGHSADETGQRSRLIYRGTAFDLRVFQTGADSYEVTDGTTTITVTARRLGAYERELIVAGRRHRIVTMLEDSFVRVEIDRVAHRVARDDGGVVHIEWPAVLISVLVAPGDEVAAGAPLAVLESMKMEHTVVAPFAGTVSAVMAVANTHVEPGAPLLRLVGEALPNEQDGRPAPVSLADLTSAQDPANAGYDFARALTTLRGFLLGFDFDPAAVRKAAAELRRSALDSAQDWLSGDALRRERAEDALLGLFTQACALFRPKSVPDEPGAHTAGPREALLGYLRILDADRAGLSAEERERLLGMLRHYGVPALERTALLEWATFRLFRAMRRIDDLAPVVADILERRLREESHAHTSEHSSLAHLHHLAEVTRGIGSWQRAHDVAGLADTVRVHLHDAPVLHTAVQKARTRRRELLAALRTDPASPATAEHIDELVRSAEPIESELLRAWRAATDDAGGDQAARHLLRQALLEAAVRRAYRPHEPRILRPTEQSRHDLGLAELDIAGETLQLVTAFVPLETMREFAADTAERLRALGTDHEVVLEVHTWHAAGEEPDLTAALASCDFGRPLRRLDLTVTGLDEVGRQAPPRIRRRSFLQNAEGVFKEQELHRDLHPAASARFGLDRLADFELRRLPTQDGVYLYLGAARQDPADQRLFVFAEVPGSAAPSETDGDVAHPWLELTTRKALTELRRAAAGYPERERPTADRLVLSTHAYQPIEHTRWPDLAKHFAQIVAGTGLQRAELRARILQEDGSTSDRTLHVESADRNATVIREVSPEDGEALPQPLTAYRRNVLRAQRLGAPYPYEIIRMLTTRPHEEALGALPHGTFAEYDLDDQHALVPVEREPGGNKANVVVGVITNHTPKVPEGMSRVIIASDPTRGLGNIAEPECRRIAAALDLAARLRLPVEWFAVSSGARIAMDSGTENMDWISAVLRALIEFTQAGGEVNIVVTGIAVGAQPYWNAEATMLMHTRGILVMTPPGTMVLTGKQALDFSGGVSAEDNHGIGGFDRVMGPNGQGQYWAADIPEACRILLRHYEHSYVVPGEVLPRRAATQDPADRDVRTSPHPRLADSEFTKVGDVFSAELNPERKKQFDIRAVMRAVTDTDSAPLERWAHWKGGETAVVWDAHLGGIPVCLLGIAARTMPRLGSTPTDGPANWTAGTLFPQSARKLARALNAASGNRPAVVLANLSGFDGSPESLRQWQLEYGAELGRAVTNFRGPIVFVVITRLHGGAFVVFSKRLNDNMQIVAVEGAFASVIGGAPAAATVFAREVRTRVEADSRVTELRETLKSAANGQVGELRERLGEVLTAVHSDKLGEMADEFDSVHTIHRAQEVGSVDRIIPAARLRPYLIASIEASLAKSSSTDNG
jgi:acetyl/propionyl-CoA carboxylase alpha subunit/acetyl-CoA carboxylase carboxyltransferase component